MNVEKVITTPRLLLSTLGEGQAAHVLDYVRRNEAFLEEWEPARGPDYYTLEAQRELLSREQANMKEGQMLKVWIYKAEEPDRIIGSVALSNIVRGVFQSCHLGYKLDGQEQANGYMTEALQAIIQYAFHEMKLHRIEANIMPRNAASMRVVSKLGFENEGLSKKYLKINGKWEDHIHMVLLNEEVE